MAKRLEEISGLPQMTTIFSGWTRKISMIRITQEIIDGFPTDFETAVSFNGVVQPLTEKKLQLKPEGQRAFKWLQINVQSGTVKFTTGDKISYQGERFKIMGEWDYSANNFVEYHAVRDFQNKTLGDSDE